MRVAIVTAVWERYELAGAWWAGLDRIRAAWAAHGHECQVFVAGSEDHHCQLAHDHGGVWVHAFNDPLGAKFNAAGQQAYHWGADYLLVLGADDFLADKVVEVMIVRAEQGLPYVGLSGCWFYELTTGRACLFEQYPVGHAQRGQPIGLGRLVHRSLLPRHGRPWVDDLNRSLDWSMTQRCKLPKASIIPIGETQVALDVKTAANIWSFTRMSKDRGVVVDHPALALIPEWPMLRAQRSARILREHAA